MTTFWRSNKKSVFLNFICCALHACTKAAQLQKKGIHAAKALALRLRESKTRLMVANDS